MLAIVTSDKKTLKVQQELPFLERKINLQRPLALLDIETTGTNLKIDRIVEIAILKIYPNYQQEEFYSLVNPQCAIPPEVSRIHGITDELVKLAPTFSNIALSLKQFLNNCDLGGFNCYKFDIPLLLIEFERAGIVFSMEKRKVVDVMSIYHRLRPRNLASAYREFCGKELENAHRAMSDIRATFEILQAQIKLEESLPTTPQGLQEFCQLKEIFDPLGKFVLNDRGQILLKYGKYHGYCLTELLELDRPYLKWLLTNEVSQVMRQKIFLYHPELQQVLIS